MSLYGSPDSIRVDLFCESRSWNINTGLTSLVIETATPGGELSVTGSISGAAPYSEILALPGVEVAVSDLGGRFRHFRFEHPSGKFTAKEGDFQLVGRGWSSHAGDDKFPDSRIYFAGTPIEQAMQDARATLCPLISPSNALVRATGGVLTSDSEDYAGKSAKAVWNALAPLGNAMWHVWGQDFGLPLLEILPYPSEPDYIVPLTGSTEASMGWDLQSMFNRVMVKYAGGYVYADDFTSQQSYPLGIGCRRTYYQDMSQSIASEQEAQALATSLLNGFAQLPPEGLGITIPYGMPVYNSGGALLPIWRLQSGRMVEIQGLPATEERLQTRFMVQQTTYDDDDRSVTLMPYVPDVIGDILKASTQQSSRSPGGIVTVVTGGGSGGGTSGGGGSSGGSGGSTGSGVVLGSTVQHQTEFGIAPDIGIDNGRAAREFHNHGTPDAPDSGPTGQYEQFLWAPDVSGVHFDFLDDGAGHPVTVLVDLV